MKINLAIAASAVALLLLDTGAAYAGQTFDWTISGSGYSGSGTLTTTNLTAANPWPCATCVNIPGYQIASFTGELNGSAITSLLTPEDDPFDTNGGTYENGYYYNPLVGFLGNDNLIYTQFPYLDWGDIGFVSNGVDYNVFNGNYTGDPGDWLGAADNDPNGLYSNPVTFTLNAVPEPGTLAVFGMAVLALGGLGLRRKFV